MENTLKTLQKLYFTGLAMGVARGVPGCASVLAVTRAGGQHYIYDDRDVAEAMRGDLALLEPGLPPGSLHYLTLLLDGMVSSSLYQRFGIGAARLTQLREEMDNLARTVTDTQNAAPLATTSSGMPVVAVFDGRARRWLRATVGKVTSRRVRLVAGSEEFVVCRDPGYPPERGLPLRAWEVGKAIRHLGLKDAG